MVPPVAVSSVAQPLRRRPDLGALLAQAARRGGLERRSVSGARGRALVLAQALEALGIQAQAVEALARSALRVAGPDGEVGCVEIYRDRMCVGVAGDGWLWTVEGHACWSDALADAAQRLRLARECGAAEATIEHAFWAGPRPLERHEAPWPGEELASRAGQAAVFLREHGVGPGMAGAGRAGQGVPRRAPRTAQVLEALARGVAGKPLGVGLEIRPLGEALAVWAAAQGASPLFLGGLGLAEFTSPAHQAVLRQLALAAQLGEHGQVRDPADMPTPKTRM